MHALKNNFSFLFFFCFVLFFLNIKIRGTVYFVAGEEGWVLKCFSDLSMSPDAFWNIKSLSVFSFFLQILKGGGGGVNFSWEGDSRITKFFSGSRV